MWAYSVERAGVWVTIVEFDGAVQGVQEEEASRVPR